MAKLHITAEEIAAALTGAITTRLDSILAELVTIRSGMQVVVPDPFGGPPSTLNLIDFMKLIFGDGNNPPIANTVSQQYAIALQQMTDNGQSGTGLKAQLQAIVAKLEEIETNTSA